MCPKEILPIRYSPLECLRYCGVFLVSIIWLLFGRPNDTRRLRCAAAVWTACRISRSTRTAERSDANKQSIFSTCLAFLSCRKRFIERFRPGSFRSLAVVFVRRFSRLIRRACGFPLGFFSRILPLDFLCNFSVRLAKRRTLLADRKRSHSFENLCVSVLLCEFVRPGQLAAIRNVPRMLIDQ